HLLSLIDDILDLSKIETGKLSVSPGPCSLRQEVNSAIALFQSRLATKNLEVRMEIHQDVPCHFQSDPTRLRQILINLIGNAIKFTESGSISVRASSNGDTLLVDVVDTGIGVSPDEVSRIFDPFAQGNSATNRKYGGTGLGLSLSQRLADALNGKLELHASVPGEGSTFRLTLPLDAKP
ncbi:MAG: hypothetical protein KDI82_17825, partial [Gammaproteobacteria bacterium]|nr:hypothetical protein [Gammaproteobacteria bacterium]